MEFVDVRLLFGVVAAIIFYIAYRFFGSRGAELQRENQKHMDAILTSDEYKVKGRFD